MSRALARMPEMGFIETIQYVLMQFLITVVGAIFGGIYIFGIFWLLSLL